MSTIQQLKRLSVAAYLEGEKSAEIRHELVDGQPYAMVGSSRTHNLIALNVASALREAVRNTECVVFMADIKVRVGDNFYYPDVLVTCDPADRQEYYSDRPTLIVEVLSPSTEAIDKREKLAAYLTLKSLREYIIVAQDKREVRIHRRSEDGWEVEVCREGDSIRMGAVHFDMSIEAVYERVRMSRHESD